MEDYDFEWDEHKDIQNRIKHGVSFTQAMGAFRDKDMVILPDTTHSKEEERYMCLGNVESDVMTVRFTWRNKKVRIIGAAFWRKGRKIYERENKNSIES